VEADACIPIELLT